MGRFLVVSKAEGLREYQAVAQEYQTGFEINDFFNPEVLEDSGRQQKLIDSYRQIVLPEGSTMHGAFLDVTLFSYDRRICQISRMRMKQSMEIAIALQVKGVVFHTNYNPMLIGDDYHRRVVEMTVEYLSELLENFPDIDIYLENMFDTDPEILVEISQRLGKYKNYGVCLDYAHVCIYGTSPELWVKALAGFVRHIHINDNDLKNDLHLAVGAGKIDWIQFSQYYHQYFQECSVLIETNFPQWQRDSLEYIRNVFEDKA